MLFHLFTVGPTITLVNATLARPQVNGLSMNPDRTEAIVIVNEQKVQQVHSISVKLATSIWSENRLLCPSTNTSTASAGFPTST